MAQTAPLPTRVLSMRVLGQPCQLWQTSIPPFVVIPGAVRRARCVSTRRSMTVKAVFDSPRAALRASPSFWCRKSVFLLSFQRSVQFNPNSLLVQFFSLVHFRSVFSPSFLAGLASLSKDAVRSRVLNGSPEALTKRVRVHEARCHGGVHMPLCRLYGCGLSTGLARRRQRGSRRSHFASPLTSPRVARHRVPYSCHGNRRTPCLPFFCFDGAAWCALTREARATMCDE